MYQKLATLIYKCDGKIGGIKREKDSSGKSYGKTYNIVFKHRNSAREFKKKVEKLGHYAGDVKRNDEDFSVLIND